jgi:ABC-type uncharacterized transport system auxiliary subunit
VIRRRVLLLPLLLGACGLSERPYAERRQWPLVVRRPETLPPRRGGKVLLVRALRAGPGLEQRGLQSMQPDGSIRTAFYEEWQVPPAEGAEDSLRRWLAASGLFSAVLAPGSRLSADLTLEGELTALWTEPAARRADAAVGVAVIDQTGGATRITLQRSFAAQASLARADPPEEAAAMCAALAEVFRQIEAALAEAIGGRRQRR